MYYCQFCDEPCTSQGYHDNCYAGWERDRGKPQIGGLILNTEKKVEDVREVIEKAIEDAPPFSVLVIEV